MANMKDIKVFEADCKLIERERIIHLLIDTERCPRGKCPGAPDYTYAQCEDCWRQTLKPINEDDYEAEWRRIRSEARIDYGI